MDRAMVSLKAKWRELQGQCAAINETYGAEVSPGLVALWAKEAQGDGKGPQIALTPKEQIAECMDIIASLEASLRSTSGNPGLTATKAAEQQRRQLSANRELLGELTAGMPHNFAFTDALRRSYEQKRAGQLRVELAQMEATKEALHSMFKRGQNSRFMPTANMKATNRKTIEKLTREIADVAGKAAAYGDPPMTTKRALPPAVPASDIISVIRLVAGIERCAEELAEKPGEFAAFHKACKGDAAALHQAADALWGSGTAADHGRAVVLRRRAQERAELATEALRLAKGAGGAGEGAAVAHGRSGAALLAELCACKDFGRLRAL